MCIILSNFDDHQLLTYVNVMLQQEVADLTRNSCALDTELLKDGSRSESISQLVSSHEVEKTLRQLKSASSRMSKLT